MLKMIKEWAIKNKFLEDENIIKLTTWKMSDIFPEVAMKERALNALAHYCEICNRGFSTIGATKLHKKFKHSNG